MPGPETPSIDVTSVFPSPFCAGDLMHFMVKNVAHTLEDQKVNIGEIEEVTPESQPKIGEKLIEGMPFDPNQMLIDLREASTAFSSMGDL